MKCWLFTVIIIAEFGNRYAISKWCATATATKIIVVVSSSIWFKISLQVIGACLIRGRGRPLVEICGNLKSSLQASIRHRLLRLVLKISFVLLRDGYIYSLNDLD